MDLNLQSNWSQRILISKGRNGKDDDDLQARKQTESVWMGIIRVK